MALENNFIASLPYDFLFLTSLGSVIEVSRLAVSGLARKTLFDCLTPSRLKIELMCFHH